MRFLHLHPAEGLPHELLAASWIMEGLGTTMPTLLTFLAVTFAILTTAMALTAVFSRYPIRRRAAYAVLVLLLKRRRDQHDHADLLSAK